MRIIRVESVIAVGQFPKSREWKRIRDGLHDAVRAVAWPPGSGKFTIHPESGKSRGKGNGVKPIKNECIRRLQALGWREEEPLDVATNLKPGNLDAVFYAKGGPVAMEWETGNVSSTHRALNKMAMGLMKGLLVGATLVLPSRNLARWLTDRIGNFPEVAPYLELWRAVDCANGILEIIVIEQDAESLDVPRIPKATDGRAQD